MSRPFNPKYKKYDPETEGYGNRQQWRQAFEDAMSDDEARIIIEGQEDSPESILGLSSSYTIDELKTAFKSCIKRWHPDLNPNNIAEAEERSKKIIAAYTVLLNKKNKR